MVSASALPTALYKSADRLPADVHFRLATPEDLQTLHQAGYRRKPFLAFRSHFFQLIDWQEHGRCYWLVGLNKSGQFVASGQLVLYPHGAELANLTVVPERRGEGVGTAMIQVLTAVANYLNLPSLEIGVATSNVRALTLYQQLGFHQDRIVQLPNDEPAIILHKDL
jgi:ribosomal protein S18 acetylase RimI-like enzyme